MSASVLPSSSTTAPTAPPAEASSSSSSSSTKKKPLKAIDDHDLHVVRRGARPRADGFVPLSKTPKAATFTGDGRSLWSLRRRVERSNFESTAERPSWLPPRVEKKPRAFVCVVDAFSTGACLAYEAVKRGYGIVHVLSLEPSEELAKMVPAHLRGALPWAAQLYVDLSLPLAEGATKVAAELKAFIVEAQKGGGPGSTTLACVCAGAETGVKLADLCSEVIALDASNATWAPRVATNGARLAEARRNKAEMGEAVRKAGVRAVRQLRANTWPPVLQWLRDEWRLGFPKTLPQDDDPASSFDPDEPCLLIVKPVESAGSDGVTACHTVGAVKKAVARLVGLVNGLGQKNEGVLVQEFLVGTEYAVDGVSRDGAHKVAAVWEYDRRATNGAGFVLHGQILLGGAHPVVAKLAPYAASVLDALDLAHGPSHMEVKLTPPPLRAADGPDDVDPCLVEVGARCHGAEGFWAECADAACGRNQVDGALDAFLDAARFAQLPALPVATLLNAACIKYLLVHKAGVLRGVDETALESITQLASYRGHEIFLQPGKPVIPTQDCFSWGGCVKLVNPTHEGMMRDYELIEQLCVDGLWLID